MSRVAEALRRATGRAVFRAPSEAPGRERPGEAVHPWGEWSAAGHRVADRPAPRIAPPRLHVATDRIEAAPSAAADGLEPGQRQQLASLVQRVFITPRGGAPPRAVAFTAAGDDVDASQVTAAAAECLAAQIDGDVCLVDAAFARPGLRAVFGLPACPGLSEALAGAAPLAPAARRLSTNFWLVDVGEATDGAPLTRDRVAGALDELTDAFDFVIVHTDAIVSQGAPGAFAVLAGAAVLVVDATRTRRDAGRAAADGLRAVGTEIVGAVLINRPAAIGGPWR